MPSPDFPSSRIKPVSAAHSPVAQRRSPPTTSTSTPCSTPLKAPGTYPQAQTHQDAWEALDGLLTRSGGTGAGGAAAEHAPAAREEAARKLISNHQRVLLDLTNASTLNIEGKPLTQGFSLRRCAPVERPHVDGFLREVARRLLGQRAGSQALEVRLDPLEPEQAAAWVTAAKYLEGRIQSTAEQKPGRTPDMGPAAAAAMKAVMAELRKAAAPLSAGAAAPAPVAKVAPAEVAASVATSPAETALATLVAPGHGFQKWLSAKASTALLDDWNETMLASVSTNTSYAESCLAHFGPYKPQDDVAGWLLGVAVLAESLPLALTVSDCSIAGFPLVYVNQKFTDVTGYTKADCVARNCRFLQGPGTNPEHGQHLLDTLRRGEDSQTMLLNYRKSGEPFENLLTMRFVGDSLGRRRFCVGFQLDLTGLEQDSGPWGKAGLASEAGQKIMTDARLKMSKLIQMLPKQITVPVPATPSTALGASGAWACPSLNALASTMGMPSPSSGSWRDALCGLLDGVSDAAIVVDMSTPMLPISFANGGFAKLTGWSVDEAVGQNCRFLQGTQTEGAALSQMVTAVRQRTACRLRITNVRKDGSPFVNELTLHPVHDSNGAYRYNIGVLVDASSGTSASAESLRRALPMMFEAELQPLRDGEQFGVVDPIAQWKQYQPMTSKLIRLLWSTDPDGAMRKFLTLPAHLSKPAITSVGKFLASKVADDEALLVTLVTQQMRGDWSAMAGRTDQSLASSGKASALDSFRP